MVRNVAQVKCTTHEVTVYMAMLGRGPVSLREIAATCGFIPMTIRSIMQRAIKRGTAIQAPTEDTTLPAKFFLTAAGEELAFCCHTPALRRLRLEAYPMAGVRDDDCLYRDDCGELAARLNWPCLSCSGCGLKGKKA